MGNNYTVYMHISPSNKIYIGITKQKLQARWGKNGQGYKNNEFFSRAIQKYGWENFTHKILFEDLTKEQAEIKEIELIKLYDTTNKHFGYNIENGGNCSITHSAQTIEKIRVANLGTKNPMYGKYGKDNPKFTQVIKTCSYCGKKFYKLKCLENRSEHNYCSLECKHKDFRNTLPNIPSKKVECVCDYCNKIVLKYPSQIHKRVYCNKICQHKHYKQLFSGSSNPNFRHGKRMKVNTAC